MNFLKDRFMSPGINTLILQVYVYNFSLCDDLAKARVFRESMATSFGADDYVSQR